VTCAEEGIMDI